MNSGRKMAELEDVPLKDWTTEELAYQHTAMFQMVEFLNAEGVSMHNRIIKEIEQRGGLPSELRHDIK